MISLEFVLAYLKLEERFRVNLARLMKRDKVSGTELGRKLEVGPSPISRWLKGVNAPSLPTISLICSVMRWDPLELFAAIPGEAEPDKTTIGHAEKVRSATVVLEEMGFEPPKLISKRKSRKS